MHLTHRRDRGIVLPLFGLVLVALLIMVAFAVDFGATAERRRASQNRSDAAALAAVQILGERQAKFLSGSVRTDAITAAEAAAKTYVAQNGGIASTSTAWDIGQCTDANALAVSAPNTNCISFSNDLTQVRVRVPDERVDYRFATVIGLDGRDVRSSAIAEVVSAVGGATRPILLRSGTSGLNCVESGGGGPATPCDGVRIGSGDFGTIDSPRYNFFTSGSDAANYALGVDHMLQLGPTNGENYCDSDANGDVSKCEQSPINGTLNQVSGANDLANYVMARSGGSLDPVTEGVVGEGGATTFEDYGGTQITALLYRPDSAPANTLITSGGPSGPPTSFAGQSGLNGVHISRYLTAAVKSDPTICAAWPNSNTVAAGDSSYATCNNSLGSYITTLVSTGATQTLFSRDIINSPRFGVAPVTDSSLSGVSNPAKIIDFYGIYIDSLYGNNGGRLKSIQAFAFPLRFIEPSSTGGLGLPYTGGPFGVRLIR